MNWWVLKKQIHSSWLITWMCGGILLGVYVARYFWNIPAWLILIAGLIIAALVVARRYLYLVPFIILAGIMIGLWRGSLLMADLAKYEPFYNRSVNIVGIVKDDVDINPGSQMTLRLGDISINNQNLPGQIWVSASITQIERGAKLSIEGTLKKGFGTFAGVIYRADVRKLTGSDDKAVVFRDWFAEGVRRAIPEPQSSLGIGFLAGQRRALPVDLLTALQVVGLTHIIVASGYNLTILVRLARRLFEKVSKYLSALASILMIIGFIAVTGASPSMTRAGLIAGLSLAAWYYGRRFHPVVLLSIAIAATVLINPNYAWGDLGWQLSFAAFAGVMIIAPLGICYFFGKTKPGFIAQVLSETIAAQLATAPILVASFGQFSNVALVSNLLILPFVPLAMLLTFIAGISGLIMPTLAPAFGWPATFLMGYMINVAYFLSDLPWAMSEVSLTWLGVAAVYLLIGVSVWYMWRVTKFNLRETNLVE